MPPLGAGAKRAAVQGGSFQAIRTYVYHVLPRSNVIQVTLYHVESGVTSEVVDVAAQSR